MARWFRYGLSVSAPPALWPFKTYLSATRWWRWGFFRVIPFSNAFLERSQGPQGNDAGYFPGGTSRKNSPHGV